MHSPDTGTLHAVLTAEAYWGWKSFAKSQGVTMTALAEVIGRRLATPDNVDPLLLPEIVDLARDVAAERRSRDPQ